MTMEGPPTVVSLLTYPDAYDRLAGNPTVDPWKLAEAMLDSRELDPDEFKLKAPGEEEPKGLNLKQMIDIAGVENDEMLRGNEVAPTAYSSPAHTEIHIQFMKSDKFKEEVPEGSNVLQIFTTHVTGEIMAQQRRQAGGGAGLPGQEGGQSLPLQLPGQAPAPTSAGGTNIAMEAAMPGRVQGGGQVPSGMPGVKAGIAGGRKLPR